MRRVTGALRNPVPATLPRMHTRHFSGFKPLTKAALELQLIPSRHPPCVLSPTGKLAAGYVCSYGKLLAAVCVAMGDLMAQGRQWVCSLDEHYHITTRKHILQLTYAQCKGLLLEPPKELHIYGFLSVVRHAVGMATLMNNIDEQYWLKEAAIRMVKTLNYVPTANTHTHTALIK